MYQLRRFAGSATTAGRASRALPSQWSPRPPSARGVARAVLDDGDDVVGYDLGGENKARLDLVLGEAVRAAWTLSAVILPIWNSLQRALDHHEITR